MPREHCLVMISRRRKEGGTGTEFSGTPADPLSLLSLRFVTHPHQGCQLLKKPWSEIWWGKPKFSCVGYCVEAILISA